MGVSDGSVLGTTKVVDHGPASKRWNLVLLGDGYQAGEMAKYHADVQDFVDRLQTTAPFDELWCGVNIYRVDVTSTDSGADDPATCDDGTGAVAATFFDASFCNNDIRRLLLVDDGLALTTAFAEVPEAHMVMVVVNSDIHGGAGGSVATFSTAPDAAEIAIHEMGHTFFGLADEYEYYEGCGTGEAGHDHYGGGDPFEPNVTNNLDRATIKWAGLIDPATALPTTANADCSDCDPQGNPVPAATVGAFEGAQYFHCGLYRPQFDCKMRALGFPFCAVCQGVIRKALSPFILPDITLTTPSVDFADVPEGLGGVGVTTFRAVVFELSTTCAVVPPVTLQISAGPSGGFGTPLGTSTVVTGAQYTPVAIARLWLSYTSTTAGDTSDGTVTVECPESGESWVVDIFANTIARPKAAVVLVLDRSGSMVEDAGDGVQKVHKLREAGNVFLNVMLEGDGLGIVRFDDTAQLLMPVTDVGPPVVGPGRIAATGHLNGPGLDPGGATSIGAGVVEGRDALTAAAGYDVKAMLVLTDGVENTPPLLAAVGGSVDARTFAIGLGKPQNISTAALDALTQGNGGYLLVTGALTPDQAARLSKYFVQVLAGITNAEVVLDPRGHLGRGAEHRIPFQLTEADYGADVILLSPQPKLIDFQLETPGGKRITPAEAGSGAVAFVSAAGVSYYRLGLPALPATSSHGGTWHAVLRLGRNPTGSTGAHGKVPYDLVVHAASSLRLRAALHPVVTEPGEEVEIAAELAEYGVPVERRADVWAEVTGPGGTPLAVPLAEIAPGLFRGLFTTLFAGLYTVRVRAAGTTFRGNAFRREQTLSIVAVSGPPQDTEGGGDGDQPGDKLCDFLRCLLRGGVIQPELRRKLEKEGFDLDALARCVERLCRPRRPD